MGGGRIKENDEADEFNYNIVRMSQCTLSTTITKKRKFKKRKEKCRNKLNYRNFT
jgi:hypothetical protein